VSQPAPADPKGKSPMLSIGGSLSLFSLPILATFLLEVPPRRRPGPQNWNLAIAAVAASTRAYMNWHGTV
jgi:hypothetical protein